MSTLRFGDAATALVAAFAAAPALAGVLVTDGPQPAAASAQDFIIVGHSGNLNADGSLSAATAAGNLTQAWLEFVAVRQETGHVSCVAVSQSGDTADIPGRRTRAQALVAACEDAATGAGVVNGLQFEGTESASVTYRQADPGCAVIITFVLGYTTQW
jgi:hypothetical protein